MTLNRYVQRIRLKRAAHWLAFRPGLSVTQVALECGYASPESCGGRGGRRHPWWSLRRAAAGGVGASDDLRAAAHYLYRQWLPASGREARGFPLFAQRLSFFPDGAEDEAVTDLFLPLTAAA
jgi:hypothetical protein